MRHIEAICLSYRNLQFGTWAIALRGATPRSRIRRKTCARLGRRGSLLREDASATFAPRRRPRAKIASTDFWIAARVAGLKAPNGFDEAGVDATGKSEVTAAGNLAGGRFARTRRRYGRQCTTPLKPAQQRPPHSSGLGSGTR
jgi:hypothetical protein